MWNPLLFADWQKIHTIFCAIMWIIVAILVAILILHGIPPQHTNPHVIIHPPAHP